MKLKISYENYKELGNFLENIKEKYIIDTITKPKSKENYNNIYIQISDKIKVNI